ncbi:MAG: hypothetical protein Q4A00_04425 [Flavobacteriaceae bacterium]|nr:hypothetical protein [Flavobacteriaceae bacterium]
MKPILTLIGILSTTIFYAQVGVNTESPTETLQVQGTFRVKELPTANEKIYTQTDGTASDTKNQNYNPVKMIVVDDNGVLGKADIPTGGGSTGGGANSGGVITGTPLQDSNSVMINNSSLERKALTGDAVAGDNQNETTVVTIQGKNISPNVPEEGQVLMWKTSQETDPQTSQEVEVGKWTPVAPTITPHLYASIKEDFFYDENGINVVDETYPSSEITAESEGFEVEKSGYYKVKMHLDLGKRPQGRGPEDLRPGAHLVYGIVYYDNINDGNYWVSSSSQVVEYISNEDDAYDTNVMDTATLVSVVKLEAGKYYYFNFLPSDNSEQVIYLSMTGSPSTSHQELIRGTFFSLELLKEIPTE